MKEQKNPYQKQIFVCTNDRKGERPSCGDHQGEAVFTELRRIAKERGLHPKIRIAQAKCLGQCAQGVTIMVYPDQTWYSSVSLSDVPKIAEKHLSEKKP
ncbi:MAG TPA: (2Fe-2S) ferredoxin domain-containing protein [Candidatus Omnitrophota bacterium]|nr:(2Fe-2S) ferredoxin domain-containing protein [Candidatus Omnitrophota bacterium]